MRGKRTVAGHSFGTFSIAARDPENGDLGVAVASKFLAVGSAVPWARAEVGAIATQSYVNTSYGPRGLSLIEEGLSAEETIDRLVSDDDGRESRQVGLVDVLGRTAAYTGTGCYDWAGHLVRADFTCQGNILTGPETLDAMAGGFQEAQGELADRLVAALSAGDQAGGDRRGKESAAVLVVREGGGYGGFNDIYVDLRVDDHPDPVLELARLLGLHRLFLGASKPEEKIAIDASLVRELQAVIKALGYYQGDINSQWDEATQRALLEFVGTENLEERVDITNRTIDPPALDHIRQTLAK